MVPNISPHDLADGDFDLPELKIGDESHTTVGLDTPSGHSPYSADTYSVDTAYSANLRNLSDDNSLEAIVYNTTNATLPNLEHFQEYAIEVCLHTYIVIYTLT